MWDPRRLTTLWASTACYRDSFTLPYLTLHRITTVFSRLFKCRVITCVNCLINRHKHNTTNSHHQQTADVNSLNTAFYSFNRSAVKWENVLCKRKWSAGGLTTPRLRHISSNGTSHTWLYLYDINGGNIRGERCWGRAYEWCNKALKHHTLSFT
jgi:hypothetical protein